MNTTLHGQWYLELLSELELFVGSEFEKFGLPKPHISQKTADKKSISPNLQTKSGLFFFGHWFLELMQTQ